MVGIYKITSPSGRVYIGQSVNIEKRFNSYKRMHVKNIKQTKLHRSFLKYGVECHSFEIILECNNSQLNNHERQYQELFNCLNYGLNCKLTKTLDRSGKVSKETLLKMSIASTGNKNWLGKKHTQDAKHKMSLAKKGKIHSEEWNKKKGVKGRVSNRKGIFSEKHPRSVKVSQFDLDGNLIKEWNCLMDIKRELGYHIGNVSSCLKGKLNTYKKFIWKYK
jgi:group I intron endonuclease